MANPRSSNPAAERIALAKRVKTEAHEITTELIKRGEWPRIAHIELRNRGQLISFCVDILPSEGICLDRDGILIVRSRDTYSALAVEGQRDSILNSILAMFAELLPQRD